MTGCRARASPATNTSPRNSARPRTLQVDRRPRLGGGRRRGLTYNVDAISRQPNTTDCHRLILWAGSSGDSSNAGKMKQRLMELYFTEGADLTDREVLVQAAVDCGMDGTLTRELLASDRDVWTA